MIRSAVVLMAIFVASKVSAKEINLKWKAIEGAKSYNIQVSAQEDFSSLLLDKSLSKNSYPYSLKPGVYYLRVQGIDQLSRQGRWSKPFRMAVTAPVQVTPEAKTPKKISFVNKKPEVEATWKNTEQATSFKVVVIDKHGKEVYSEETKDAKINYKPQGPGDYKVMVRSGFGQYYGPPVSVQEIHVEQKELEAPKWETSKQKWSSKKAVELDWGKVDGAEAYKLKLYKVDEKDPQGRNIASDAKPILVAENIVDGHYVMPALPPGRYVANIEAREGETSAAPTSSYQFEVKNEKPLEIEKFDFSMRYNFTNITYDSQIYESSNTPSTSMPSRTSSLGGAGQVDGAFFLPDSHWGIKAQGIWGGFYVNKGVITYNKFMLAATHRSRFLGGEVRPYVGGRMWSMPIIFRDQDSSSNNDNSGGSSSGSSSSSSTSTATSSNSPIQVMAVTVYGPVAGLDLTRGITNKIALTAHGQAALALGNSTLGSGDISQIQTIPTWATEIDAGVKYALPGNIRLLAMAGIQNERIKWTPVGRSAGSDAKSTVGSSSTIFGVGIEATDDAGFFQSATEAAKPAGHKFSDFDLTAGYRFTPIAYYGHNPEFGSSADSSFRGNLSGTAEMSALGWFYGSKHGGKLSAAWGGFIYQNTTISYPEYNGQWAFKPDFKLVGERLSFVNYFGVRSWVVPVIRFDDRSGNFQPKLPQLIGPMETIEARFKLNDQWSSKITGQVSAPFLVANKDTAMEKVYWQNVSTMAELDVIRKFSDDLSVGVGGGYKVDELKYTYTGLNDANYSTSRISTPLFSVFGAYSF